MEYKFGATACYIADHPFMHIMEIPSRVALIWVQLACPNVDMGNGVNTNDLTVSNTDIPNWLNKLFIIVGGDHGKFVAIYKHDDHFSLYVQI